MKKIKVLSLFSGIGAFEKALKNLDVDFELVNYCEIDKFASYAYSVLHDIPENLNLGDISKVNIKNIKDFDLLTYGFPCQDISLAGKLKGIVKGETRSGLLFEALKIINDKKPKIAIAENVKNLVGKRFINDFNSMIKELDYMGYNSYWSVINSKNYGIPQSRERVFIVSIRKDIDKGTFKFNKPDTDFIKLSDILEDHVDKKYYIKNKYTKDFIRDINNKICNNKNPNLFGLIRAGVLNNPNALDMNNRVFSIEGASPTITTGSNSIPKILECTVRKLTPLECWKLQGFTREDYIKVKQNLENKFYNGKDKTTTQMYKMAGNSITVQVVENIIYNLLNILS
ncbi:DNA cytosine methyltransferase [Clostridium niameyense]|uniref:Cytosine-specific methyltransferase n=1 Tax=Clostridium niameyense TaxID=1622073 RepID=A0A6M0RBC5_9CLOT|nr:DNA cytosine methyltransferase [Clostridium niameyense]NEZ46488.1 DNA cytosine methyltransferase [Clostridium niameyense]